MNNPAAEKSLNPDLKVILSEYVNVFLMCYDLIGSNIMGDYYLNTRNTNIQKMIKLSLYYELEDLSQQIIAFISKECLFQRNFVSQISQLDRRCHPEGHDDLEDRHQHRPVLAR